MRGAAWPLRAPMLLLFCQIQRQITLHTRHSGGHVLAAVNDGLGMVYKALLQHHREQYRCGAVGVEGIQVADIRAGHFTRFCAAYRRFDGIEFFPQAVRPHRCTIGAILALHIGAEERSGQPLCGIRIFAVGIHAHQYLRVIGTLRQAGHRDHIHGNGLGIRIKNIVGARHCNDGVGGGNIHPAEFGAAAGAVLVLLCIDDDNVRVVVALGRCTVHLGVDALYAQSVSAEETAAVSFVLKSPQLWWPNTYGEQPLYTLNVELHDKDSQVLDDWHKQIGLRELTISRNQDEWGEEFCFRVNGVKIFAMGADYIPEDSVVTRVTPEQTLRLLKDCAAANFNTIRVWGGGYYPDDWFYDACDRLGLIVWQDAMFACNVYRMDAAFEENIRAELRDNLLRIRHHACLGLLCGNNEMELGWVGWEDVVTHHPALKADYIKMFEYVISQEAQINAPDVFYWPSSPSSGGSFDDPNAENRGDVHYWDVWHRMKPFTDYEKFYFRFCSEFGFESFPGRKTIETFTEPSDRNIFSPVMESHQKNGAANGLIMFYISSYYRYPKDFDSLLYISQLLQAEAMRHGVEHWRRNRGRCMGAIYWQLNDCWPVASWASIDYFGRWKALHYYARRFFSPRMVTAKAEDAKLRMWVHNDSRTALEGTVEVELRDTAYGLLAHMEVPVQVPPLSVTELDPVDFMQELAERGQDTVFVAYRLCEKNNTGAYASTLFCRPKQMELPRPNYTVHVLDCGNVFDIYVKSDCYAHQVEIETNLTDRPFSDNYFSLCTPQGVHVALEKDSVAPGVTAEQLRESLQVRSVADTF